MADIKLPAAIRKRHNLPAGPLQVVSAWGQGDKLGLWIGRAGESTGQRWPVTGVDREDAKKWMEAANA